MPNLTGNLLFEHLDKFQAYTTNFRHILLQSARKLNPNLPILFRWGILQIKWVSFYSLNVFFMTNLICPLLSFMFNFIHSSATFWYKKQPQKRRLVELILTNTWLALLHKQHISKIKHNSPDSIQINVDELIC